MVSSKKKIAEGINAAMSSVIDDIKFDQKPSQKQRDKMKMDTPLVTIDWRNMLPEPPKNSSEVTKKELLYVAEQADNLSPEEKNRVLDVDDSPEAPFIEYCKKYDLIYPKKKIATAYEESLRPVILKLKWKYQRPRPYQLAPEYGIKLSVITTDTHQTPAYPSGHTAYASMVAAMLSEIHPLHAYKFYEMALEVGNMRVQQGVHFPSDNSAGMLLGTAIWENIKYDILPSRGSIELE